MGPGQRVPRAAHILDLGVLADFEVQLAADGANYANVVSEVSQANASLHSQMITQQAEVRASVFKILTPAQQQQLAALEAQAQTRHGAGGPRG
jgi:Spy/CpxP family protein refolding chaperone